MAYLLISILQSSPEFTLLHGLATHFAGAFVTGFLVSLPSSTHPYGPTYTACISK